MTPHITHGAQRQDDLKTFQRRLKLDMIPNKMNEEAENPHPKEGIQVADVAREKRTCIAKVYNPNAGDRINDYKLVGQLDVVSAEADLWIAEHGGQEFVCKLYRHGVTSSLVSSGAVSALDHPHLLPTKITGDHLGRQYEIVPFYPGGSLADCLAGGKKMDLANAEKLLEQLTEALSYLHGQGIQHRDIKPANILLRKANPLDVVMSDFGRSEESSATMLTMSRTTLLYSAPEAVNGMFSAASDWWSVGMVILESITGKHPLSQLPANQQHYAIVSGHIPIPQTIPERWQSLLRGLLAVDHTQRWMGEQVTWWLTQTHDGELPVETARPRFTIHLSPLTAAILGIPVIVIATRYLGPVVEEFLGIIAIVWVICLLGMFLKKMRNRK